MGAILSRRKKKQSTEEVLKDIQSKIEALEESKKIDVEKQKHLIGSLILYSIIIYIGAALLFYFYYVPESVTDRITYASPLAVFPVLVWLVKRFLHWYFIKRISKNEAALHKLKEEKKQILEDVMETETYKKAKEILEKFDPDVLLSSSFVTPVKPMSPEGQDLRMRKKASSTAITKGPDQDAPSHATTTPTGQPGYGQQTARPSGSRPNLVEQKSPQLLQQAVPTTASSSNVTKPPLLRPLLPENRTMFDRFVDYLLGDGPQNRYALICRNCHCHNGMALKEEYEYFSFHCCYCNFWNPARKQRPTTTGQQPQQPADVTRQRTDGNLDSKLRNQTNDSEVRHRQSRNDKDKTEEDTD